MMTSRRILRSSPAIAAATIRCTVERPTWRSAAWGSAAWGGGNEL